MAIKTERQYSLCVVRSWTFQHSLVQANEIEDPVNSALMQMYIVQLHSGIFAVLQPRVGSGVVRIDPLRFML